MSTALVKAPLTAYQLARLARMYAARSPYTRAGLRLASTAYSNRRYFRPAYNATRLAANLVRSKARAKLITSKRTKFGTSNVGQPVGVDNGKHHQSLNTNPTSKSTRTLYDRGLFSGIVRGQNLNNRERNIIDVRGVRVCMELHNTSTSHLLFNIAVISPKAAADAIAITSTNFFRSEDNTDSRGDDFADALTSNEFHCLPINTDLYTVLKHQRMVLAPAPGDATTFQSNTRDNYTTLQFWVPIKRQIRYENSTGEPVDGNCFVVYWADQAMKAGGTTAVPSYEVTERFLTYFREPANCC